MKHLLKQSPLLLATLLLLVPAPAVFADSIDEGFDPEDGWTQHLGYGTYSNGSWLVNSAAIRGPNPPYYSTRSGAYACWLNQRSASTNSWARLGVASGAGSVSFWVKAPFGSSDFVLERSATGQEPWTALTNFTHASDAWTEIQYSVGTHGAFYLRIRKTDDDSSLNAYLGIDDVTITDPPSKVVVSNLATDPQPVYIGDTAHVQCDLALLGPVSNLVVTSFWQRAAGPWTAVRMTNTVGNTYRTAKPISAQDQVGIPIHFYVRAWFDGFNPVSPVTTATNTYSVRRRELITSYDAISVTGDPGTSMALYDDYAWQGIFQPVAPLVDATFQFSGVHTNGATPTWGENRTAAPPFPGTAEVAGPAITIAGTHSNPLVFTFDEASLNYSVREGFFQDFSGWTTAGFTNETQGGWAVYNTLVTSDTNRQYNGNAAYLNSNGVAALRSPPLPDGIGEISFWYRNYSRSGSPVTRCVIQKSDTGGTNESEWVTIAGINDIYGTEYGRYSLRLNDRHLRYIRIRNSTNNAHAALCIDHVLLAFAGAGVVMSNLTAAPAAPTVFDPVTISADITPRAGASALEATVYWRSGSAGPFSAIGMANGGGNTYVATNAIPAGAGDGHGGAGTVEYYISCSFQGYESELASPDTEPGGGADDPASYTIVPARVFISNVQQSPDPARSGTGVAIAADATPATGAFDVSLATWYRVGTNGPFARIDMSESSSNHFETATLIPGNVQPGATVQYFVQATFFGPSATSPTNYPPGGASNPTSFVFRAAEPTGTYTSVRVTGDFNTNLMLIADHTWQGVASVEAFTHTFFYFEAVNGGVVNWGDDNPSYTDPPLLGTAETGAVQIVLLGTYPDSHFVFRFNETNHAYSVQRAEYVNFDQWDSATGDFGGSTNSEDWIISGARTTTPSGEDLERTFGGSGRSCILSHTNSGLQYVRSPGIGEGVGEIGFWYRNWRDDGMVQPAGFEIQKSNDRRNWITVDTVTNILSADYVHYSLTLSEPLFYYIRIVNSTNTPRGRLCLDEVFMARPGPWLDFTNVKNTPSAPNMIDDVIIEGNITPMRGATNIQATVWLRAGTNGIFESIAMTNTAGNHFETVTTLPKGWAGTMQYYIEASFEGMYVGERVTTYEPFKGAIEPNSYNSATANNAETDFDDWTKHTAFGTYTNADGWVANDAMIRGGAPYYWTRSNPHACWLNQKSPTNSWLRSTWLSNGAGLISFWARTPFGFSTFALQRSLNGVDWDTLEEYSESASDEWTEHLYFLNELTPQYLRIIKVADDLAQNGFLGIDDVTVSFPPAEIRIVDIDVTPVYPDDSGAPQIQCKIESVNPFLEAIGILAEVYYRTEGDSTFYGPAPMTRNGNTFTCTTGIPTFDAGALVEYYIQTTFKGYSESPREARSPSFYPAGLGNVSTNQYFLAPTNKPAAYYVRPRSMAGHQNFDVWTNATDAGNHSFEEWSMSDGRVTNLPQGVWHSTAWAAELLNTDGDFPDSYIQSPVLTNGVGTLAFFARNATNSTVQLRVRVSTNGSAYTTAATVTNTSHTAWTRHAVELNTTVPTTIRLYKQNETYDGETVWIDDVEMAFIPTAVRIDDVVLHPGYPAAGTAVDVACKVTALPSVVQEAANVSVGLYYRNATTGGPFSGPVPMLLEGDTYSMLSPIPGSLNDSRDTIEYYIEVTFDGYAYTTERNARSPSYYPEGPVGVSAEHYYAAPSDEPAEYTVRPYASDYGSLRVDLNGGLVEMRQNGDGSWVGVVFLNDPISSGEIYLRGAGYYDGSQYLTSIFEFGDTAQNRARLPYVGTMNFNEDAVVVSNMTRGAYVIRFDEETLTYRVERGTRQDFDTWTASPTYFERNYSHPQIADTSPNFDQWALSSNPSFPEDFASWFIMPDYWDGICPSGEVGYVVYDAQILRDMTAAGTSTTSLTCRLKPTALLGEVRTRPETVADGVGTVSIEYRCLDDTFAPTLISTPDTWNGVMVEADLRAQALPEAVDGSAMGSNTWMSIFARYLGADTYYELRTEQIGLNRQRLRLIRNVSGSETVLWSEPSPTTGRLTAKQTLKLLVTTYDTNKAYLQVYQNGTQTNEFWDDVGAITTAGDVGFRAQSLNMEVDDVRIGECALQSFKTWPPTGGVDQFSKDGWEVVHAYQIIEDQYVVLEDGSAVGLTNNPSLRSPLLKHGMGSFEFDYYKVGGDDSIIAVQWSTNQVNWTSVDTFVASADNSWRTYSGDTGVAQSNVYIRIINATNSANEKVRLRDVRIEPSLALAPFWDYTLSADGWTDAVGTWSVGNGKYNGTAISDPLDVAIQTRPVGESVPWTTQATFTDRTNVAYRLDSVDIETGEALLVRVVHTGGSGSIVLNNVDMTAWRGDTRQVANGWRISEGWIIGDPKKTGRCLETRLSRRRIGAEQYLLSPQMTNGVGTISFRAISATGDPVSFQLQSGLSTSSFETVVEVTNSATAWTDPESYFGWTLNTNQSLYLRIVNTTPDPDTPLLIDTVTATDFGEIDLYSWRAYNALITSVQGDRLRDTAWNVNGAYLNSNAVDQVNPAQYPLDNDMPFIQSGYLDDGIGEISFWYRGWDAVSAPALRIKMAPTASTPSAQWRTLTTLPSITNTVFSEFIFQTYNSSNHYVRFYCDTNANPNGRICLDDILITAPFGSEVYLENIRIDPEIPLEDTPVHVLADITERFLNPSNITLTAYYRTDPTNGWGLWKGNNPLPMELVSQNGSTLTYRTIDPIPADKPIDALVQYYVAANYDGLFSEATTPRELRDFTNPDWYYPVDHNDGVTRTNPYYYVFSCPPGDVWMNEINLVDDFAATQYIELAGIAGIDVGGWKIEILDDDFITNGWYTIQNATVLPNTADGYGFWVLGEAGMGSVADLYLTNGIPEYGAVRLYRSMGAIEDGICFGYSVKAQSMDDDPANRLRWIGWDDDWETSPLAIEGTGSNRTDFVAGEWGQFNTYTPGRANAGQTLIERNDPPIVVELSITDHWLTDTQVWLVLQDNYTNDLNPTPWYSTNLMDTNAWYEATGASHTYNDGVYTQQFDRPISSPVHFYRVTGSY